MIENGDADSRMLFSVKTQNHLKIKFEEIISSDMSDVLRLGFCSKKLDNFMTYFVGHVGQFNSEKAIADMLI